MRPHGKELLMGKSEAEGWSLRFSACSRALFTSSDVDEGVVLPKKMLNLGANRH